MLNSTITELIVTVYKRNIRWLIGVYVWGYVNMVVTFKIVGCIVENILKKQ